MKQFKTGVNFGCWISQYRELDYNLFRKMSTREDVFRVRDWGFDHIRLPFDYPLLLDDKDLYTFKPQASPSWTICLPGARRPDFPCCWTCIGRLVTAFKI